MSTIQGIRIFTGDTGSLTDQKHEYSLYDEEMDNYMRYEGLKGYLDDDIMFDPAMPLCRNWGDTPAPVRIPQSDLQPITDANNNYLLHNVKHNLEVTAVQDRLIERDKREMHRAAESLNRIVSVFVATTRGTAATMVRAAMANSGGGLMVGYQQHRLIDDALRGKWAIADVASATELENELQNMTDLKTGVNSRIHRYHWISTRLAAIKRELTQAKMNMWFSKGTNHPAFAFFTEPWAMQLHSTDQKQIDDAKSWQDIAMEMQKFMSMKPELDFTGEEERARAREHAPAEQATRREIPARSAVVTADASSTCIICGHRGHRGADCKRDPNPVQCADCHETIAPGTEARNAHWGTLCRVRGRGSKPTSSANKPKDGGTKRKADGNAHSGGGKKPKPLPDLSNMSQSDMVQLIKAQHTQLGKK